MAKNFVDDQSFELIAFNDHTFYQTGDERTLTVNIAGFATVNSDQTILKFIIPLSQLKSPENNIDVTQVLMRASQNGLYLLGDSSAYSDVTSVFTVNEYGVTNIAATVVANNVSGTGDGIVAIDCQISFTVIEGIG